MWFVWKHFLPQVTHLAKTSFKGHTLLSQFLQQFCDGSAISWFLIDSNASQSWYDVLVIPPTLITSTPESDRTRVTLELELGKISLQLQYGYYKIIISYSPYLFTNVLLNTQQIIPFNPTYFSCIWKRKNAWGRCQSNLWNNLKVLIIFSMVESDS